jgi:hypothetical protein
VFVCFGVVVNAQKLLIYTIALRQELFGTENLLKFKDGCFLDEIWKKVRPEKSRKRTGGLNIHETSALARELGKIGEDRCEELLHEDIGDLDAVTTKDNPTTQNAAFETSGGVEEKPPNASSEIHDSSDMIERAETKLTIGAHALNHEDLFREDRGGAAIEMGEEGFDDEMGGATQNAFAVYEERGEDFAEDRSDNDDEKLESTCIQISSKNEQDGTILSSIKEEDGACSHRDEGAINAYTGKNDRNSKESVPTRPPEDYPPFACRNGEAETHNKRQNPAPRSLKINLVGQPSTSGVETTFSVADIPIPTYQSTKTKGKKKKRKRKVIS